MLSLVTQFITNKLTYVGGMLTALWMFLKLVRNDESKKWALEALQEAQRANEEAARARRASTLESDRGRLREDDGYRRD